MAVKASREFQIFAKPIGAICNLDCHYCYYLQKESLYPQTQSFRMAGRPAGGVHRPADRQIAPTPEINFFWHGGEPTLLGLDYYRNIVELQRKHQPPGRRITNGIQTNGVLLNDDWCRFFAAEQFAVGLSLDGPQALHDAYRVTKGQKPTHKQVMQGYRLLRQHKLPVDLLCVVHAENVKYPLEVYRFFKDIKAQYLSFIPLVERQSWRRWCGPTHRAGGGLWHVSLHHFRRMGTCRISGGLSSRCSRKRRDRPTDRTIRCASFGPPAAMCRSSNTTGIFIRATTL